MDNSQMDALGRGGGRRYPNLFVIGAGKSASSSLHRILDQHPEIHMSIGKEPNFFGYDWDQLGHEPDVSEYLDERIGHSDCRWVGESSIMYISNPRTPQRILSKSPDARFLICVRDPVDRAYAAYLMNRNTWNMERQELRSFDQCVEDELSAIQEGRETPWHRSYIGDSRLGHLLRNWLEFFPPERFHLVDFRRLCKNPIATVQDIARFLDVDPESFRHATVPTINPYKGPRNWLAEKIRDMHRLRRIVGHMLPSKLRWWIQERIIMSGHEKPPMSEESRRKLQAFFDKEPSAQEVLSQALEQSARSE